MFLPSCFILLAKNSDKIMIFQSSDEKKEENKWMVEIVAKCLIWLGDLNRYRLEILEGRICHLNIIVCISVRDF